MTGLAMLPTRLALGYSSQPHTLNAKERVMTNKTKIYVAMHSMSSFIVFLQIFSYFACLSVGWKINYLNLKEWEKSEWTQKNFNTTKAQETSTKINTQITTHIKFLFEQ